jgi:hypothetical protein
VKRLEGKPFALIGINSDPDREELRAESKAQEIPWHIVWDGIGGGPIVTAWNIRSRPKTYVLDHRGVIRYKDVFDEELDKAVDALLGEVE